MAIQYGHGDDKHLYSHINFKANFSSNVWFTGSAPDLKEHLRTQINTIDQYPAPSGEFLKKQIAAKHEVSEQNILVSNGATEAFYLIAQHFSKKRVSICYPSFSEYELASRVHGLQIEYLHRQDCTTHQFNSDIAFICNPNNPDGFENSSEEIALLLKKHPDTYFVIDEAYIEFTSSAISVVPLLAEHNNLIIVKSLTKVFGIPGLRLGYLMGATAIIDAIAAHKMPWNVNGLALSAGRYIFQNYASLYPNFSTYLQRCYELQTAISEIPGFRSIPSRTSYFLVKMQDYVSQRLKNYLAEEHQLLIRDASNFKGLDQRYFRISGQSDSENNLLIKALKAWKH
ncbi:conserved hypothetical protein [Tenacibaculum litopenaei]|uniref:pyridoxal phosphate-dependent aminotransferase n=1 Tax=Tenacibaculum litopenaei TaxID=396016 RepID=UPI0038936DFF